MNYDPIAECEVVWEPVPGDAVIQKLVTQSVLDGVQHLAVLAWDEHASLAVLDAGVLLNYAQFLSNINGEFNTACTQASLWKSCKDIQH